MTAAISSHPRASQSRRVTFVNEQERRARLRVALIESVRAPIGAAKAQSGAEGRDE